MGKINELLTQKKNEIMNFFRGSERPERPEKYQVFTPTPPPLPRKFEVMKRILDDAIFYDSINEVDVSIGIFYNLIAKIEAHILDID